MCQAKSKKSFKKVLYIESAKRPHLGEIRENLDATNGSEIRENRSLCLFERYGGHFGLTAATNTTDPDDLLGFGTPMANRSIGTLMLGSIWRSFTVTLITATAISGSIPIFRIRYVLYKSRSCSPSATRSAPGSGYRLFSI